MVDNSFFQWGSVKHRVAGQWLDRDSPEFNGCDNGQGVDGEE